MSYSSYIRPELPYIDPENETVKSIVKELDAKADNDLEFARLAYSYVQDNIKRKYGTFSYRLPLAETLKKRRE